MIAGFIVSGIVLTSGIIFLVIQIKKVRMSTLIDAQISDIIEEYDEGKMHRPVFKYIDESGIECEYRSSLSSNFINYDIGDPARLIYDKDKIIGVADFNHIFLWPYIIVYIGISISISIIFTDALFSIFSTILGIGIYKILDNFSDDIFDHIVNENHR